MNRQPEQTKNMREVWGILLRYRWRFVLPMFLTATGVLAGGLLLPRKYQAEAIFERRTDMVLAEITNRGATHAYQSPRASATEELSGPPAVDNLIEWLKPRLKADPLRRHWLNNLDDLRADIARRLVVRYDVATTELDRVRVTYTCSDAGLAQLVVNTLVQGYIDRTQEMIDRRLKQSETFFAQEADRERNEIESQENKQLTFEITHAELMPDNPSNFQSTVNQSQTELSELEQKCQAAALREESLKHSLEMTPQSLPSVITAKNPELTRIENKTRELQTQLEMYLGVLKMTDKHPDLVSLREQIAALKKEADATEREVVVQRSVAVNPRYAEVELQLAAVTAERRGLELQRKAIKDRVAMYNSRAASLFPVRSDYRKLSRDIEEHQRQLTFWEDNLRRVRMALAAENGDRGVKLDFLKPCAPLERPISPDLTQLLMAAIALGLLMGGVNVFVAQRSDESFVSGEELAKAVNLPLFGAVSEVISNRERRLRRLRRMLLYPIHATAMATVLALAAGLLYLSLEHPQTYESLKRHPVRTIFSRLAPGPAQTLAAQADRE